MTRILALTDLRPDELEAPLDAADAGTVVSMDRDASASVRVRDVLARGLREATTGDYDALLVYNGVGLLGAVAVLLGLVTGLPLLVRVNGDLERQHAEKADEHRRAGEWRGWLGYRLAALLTGVTFRRAAGFLPVSSNLAEPVARRANCAPERVRTVHSPIRVAEYRPDGATPPAGDEGRQFTGVDEDLPPAAADEDRLLTVTNLDYRGKYEGTCELARALAPLLAEREEVTWVIAGDGRYLADLRQHLDESLPPGVRDRVRAPGFVDDVAAAYAAAAVFVYRSHIDGYPNAVREAQAAGLPVVANPAHGITEQVDHGRTGLLVDEPAAVREAVEDLLSDPAARRRLGRRASDAVERENDPAVVGRQLVIAVEQLLAAAEGDRPRSRGDRRRPPRGREEEVAA